MYSDKKKLGTNETANENEGKFSKTEFARGT